MGMKNIRFLLLVKKQRYLSGYIMEGACPAACEGHLLSTCDKE
jgi:hypothetical protein